MSKSDELIEQKIKALDLIGDPQRYKTCHPPVGYYTVKITCSDSIKEVEAYTHEFMSLYTV